MKEASLVKIKDKRFDSVMQSWVTNINTSIYSLHLNESTYFYDNIEFAIIDTRDPDREFSVTTTLKNTLRKRRLFAGKTILVGYDTQYLKPDVLEAILCKFRAISAYKDVTFKQITAAKITQTVDYLLYEDYFIPDLIFVVIEIPNNVRRQTCQHKS